MGSTIVKKFPQVGDLYVSSGSSVVTSQSLFSVKEAGVNKDWHVILGHPLDLYVKKFLELFKLPMNDQTGSEINCKVCQMAKIK
jgi:hypothetical protein